MLVVLVNSKGVDLPINNMQFDKVLLQPPCLGQKYNLQYSATMFHTLNVLWTLG
jgi:hypothetical protein